MVALVGLIPVVAYYRTEARLFVLDTETGDDVDAAADGDSNGGVAADGGEPDG